MANASKIGGKLTKFKTSSSSSANAGWFRQHWYHQAVTNEQNDKPPMIEDNEANGGAFKRACKNYKRRCGERFWLGARRRGRCTPAVPNEFGMTTVSTRPLVPVFTLAFSLL